MHASLALLYTHMIAVKARSHPCDLWCTIPLLSQSNAALTLACTLLAFAALRDPRLRCQVRSAVSVVP